MFKPHVWGKVVKRSNRIDKLNVIMLYYRIFLAIFATMMIYSSGSQPVGRGQLSMGLQSSHFALRLTTKLYNIIIIQH
jgi:hypothetical protein